MDCLLSEETMMNTPSSPPSESSEGYVSVSDVSLSVPRSVLGFLFYFIHLCRWFFRPLEFSERLNSLLDVVTL